jgi:phage shock protein C
MKRLYRSREDVMIGGVCSGIAKYLEMDPTVVRLVFVLLLFLSGAGFWIYVVLWVIMPVEPKSTVTSVQPAVVEVKEKPALESAAISEKVVETKKTTKPRAKKTTEDKPKK